MRRIAGSILFALVLTLATVGSALGHVHGVTPLGCNDNDNAAKSGARQTDNTPAAERAEPLGGGVIPNNATPGDQPGEAGQHSSLCDEE